MPHHAHQSPSASALLAELMAIVTDRPSHTSLEDGLQQVVQRARSLLGVDRVLIYRFLPDQDAVIAAESAGAEARPLRGELIYDPCFEAGWVNRYRQGHISRVDDIHHGGLNPCYVDLLTRLQVQANLAVPIFCGDRLWALLIAHQCHHPRPWQDLDVVVMQHIAHHLGQTIERDHLQRQMQTERELWILALQSAETALRRRIDQEALLNTITLRMRSSLDLAEVLANTAAEVRDFFEADRAVIYQLCGDGQRRVVQQAIQSPYSAVDLGLLLPEALPAVFRDRFHQGQPCIVDDVDQVPWAGAVATFLRTFQVKSAMIAPISSYDQGRNHTLWGILAIHACQRRPWQPQEADMLQQVANQLAIAIHQAELYGQLAQANQELNRLARTDALTQLANRRWLDEYLRQEWYRLARLGHPLSVVLIDVDHFKAYNDTYGHAAGDQVLSAIARAIKTSVRRSTDLAARYGGEEFALVLPNTETAGALQVVETIRQTLQKLALPHGAQAHQPFVTLSFGLATQTPTPTEPWEQLMHQADIALYAAKAKGRNRYDVFGTQ